MRDVIQEAWSWVPLVEEGELCDTVDEILCDKLCLRCSFSFILFYRSLFVALHLVPS